MNRIKNNLIYSLLAFSLLACESYVGDGINENPNEPLDVPVSVSLPAIQVFIADVVGGDLSRHNSLLVQQCEGVNRQWASFNNYSSLNPAQANTTWNNTYENILVELDDVKAKSIDLGYTHYEAAANVLIAYTLMYATDIWDDIPYTEAFQGVGNISPVFDTQASIYDEIFSLLDVAVGLFEGPDGDFPLGSTDVYYGGTVSNWIKLAYAIEARGRLHLGQYQASLDAVGNAFTSADENASYTYPDDSNPAQWYRFNRDREGDIEFHPTMKELMENLNDDVRLALFDNTFNTSHPYLVSQFRQAIITYREMKFIEAEALFRTGAADEDVHAAYTEAIIASFEHLDVLYDDIDFLAASDDFLNQEIVDPGPGSITLEHILTQKYIGMFTDPELYADWRRTGIPSLTPVSGTAIPVRWAYGSDEHLFNANAPDENSVDIFTNNVGWDQ